MKTISIAKDFTPYPGGRIPADGPHSGQEFREKFLMPIFETEEKIEIIFDGVWGYGSSFLEESFGGLVRRGIPKEKIYKQITFISKKESIIEEVKRYIDSARA
ncbi:STAS-like domain-containing protein [Bilophila wadsworthia]|jgi:hypothetical protein|uniref:STAS-like domain-containing protein n=1 Tax=Bilophila wadsworthia TaxID=35833 RepID=UPI001D8D6D19|nr:STAS-like domain-containing protein [Bilophila wadsworthia]MBS5375719.1 STAS-like domain-containing protein [Bilophila wadsworthia]